MDHPPARHMVIRADASIEMGTGHLMRCLALGQAWRDAGGRVTFVTCCDSDRLVRRLEVEGFEVVLLDRPYPDAGDWEVTGSTLGRHPDAWVVLDGYHLDDDYQRYVKETGNRLLSVDDMAHLEHYYADIVLNQNLHADQVHYSCEPYTTLLLGTRYALLRREFLAWRTWKREIPEVAHHVLVTLGGSDPENNSLKVIQALQGVHVPEMEVAVIIGAGNPHAAMLQTAAKGSNIAIRLIQDADNMPELMAWADVAVSAAGTTVWELFSMGVPACLITVADNQEPIARSASRIGAAIWADHNLTNWPEVLADGLCRLILDPESRSNFSYRARSLVDGLGGTRIMQAVHELESRRSIRL